MSGALSELRQLVDGLREVRAPERARAAARMGVLDCIGCILGGCATPTARKVLALAREQGFVPKASVLGTRDRLAAPLAALANGVAGHVLDYDDMSSTVVGHPSVVLVPAAFALGEAREASGAEVLGAYLAGFEVQAWFGRRMIPRHYDAGWHSTSSLGVFASAVASSRLLGLDTDATINALAIAASSVAGLRANFGSEAKSLHAGQAAENGVRAALLSAAGFRANATDVFDGRLNLFAAYRANEPPKPRLAGLEIEASGIGIKPYPCCGAGVSVIDAALDLHARHALAGAPIERVDVTVSPMATSIMPFGEPADGLQARYSLAYCAAVALLDRKAGLAQFDDERVRGADVRALLSRTRVQAEPRMASGAGRFGVEMSVELVDGTSVATSLELPRGHPSRPLEREGQLAKFVECAGPVIGAARARQAAERLEAIEAEPSLAALVELLKP